MTEHDLTHPDDGTVVLDAGGYAWQFDGLGWCLATMGTTGRHRPGAEFIRSFGPLRVLYVPTKEDSA